MKSKKNRDSNYIHIFPKEKFTDDYVNFVNQEFSSKEHLFFVYGNKYYINCISEMNVIEYNGGIKDWINLNYLFHRSKGIIFHSFPPKQMYLTTFMQPWLLKKVNIVFWGSDLYSYLKPQKTILSKISKLIRSSVIKRVKFVTTLVNGDYSLVKKWYKHKGISLQGVYIDSSYSFLEDLRKSKSSLASNLEERTVNILLGNNAQISNNHIEALNMLKNFRDEDIKIYTPLSYSGENDYIQDVIREGKIIFGDKFIPMLDFMSRNAYYELLNEIDIGVFNNSRQQAIGNINALTYLGAKIFVRNDTSMWDHFVKENNFILTSVYDIPKMNLITFAEYNEEDKKHNIRMMSYLVSNSYKVNIWSNVFHNMNKNNSKEANS